MPISEFKNIRTLEDANAAIRRLLERVAILEGNSGPIKPANEINMGGFKITNGPANQSSARDSEFITKKYLSSSEGANIIADLIKTGGIAPVRVDELSGVTILQESDSGYITTSNNRQPLEIAYIVGTRADMHKFPAVPEFSTYQQIDPAEGYDYKFVAHLGEWVFKEGDWTSKTFAERPNPNDIGYIDDPDYMHIEDDGAFFTDSTYGITWRYKRDGMLWEYYSGVYEDTFSNIPTTLTTEEAGFKFYATDLDHTWVWDGSAWDYDDLDDGSGYIVISNAVPRHGVWQVCDGSTVDVANADGTVTATTVPDYSPSAYLKIGDTASLTPDAASGSSGTPSGTTDVQSGSGATVSSSVHTHDSGTLELRRITLVAYYRR